MAMLSIAAAFVLILMRILHLGLFRDRVVMGYTSLICTVLFIGSVQLLCTGVVGEYLGRVYDEVKRRPLFVIRSVQERTAGHI